MFRVVVGKSWQLALKNTCSLGARCMPTGPDDRAVEERQLMHRAASPSCCSALDDVHQTSLGCRAVVVELQRLA